MPELFYMMTLYDLIKKKRWLATMVPMMKELCIEYPKEAICEEDETRAHERCIYSYIR